MSQELDRLRSLLRIANDKGAVELQIAGTYAAGGQYRAAMDQLQKVVDADLGFDPSRDPDLRKLQNTIEFQQLEDKVLKQTPPISNSRVVATLPEGDLFPENLAYDPLTKNFFLGSTSKNEIVQWTHTGVCKEFVSPHADGVGYVLGLKIHQPSRTLWTTSNEQNGASLRQFRLADRHLAAKYFLPGQHIFNDLAIFSDGTVFVTDTKEGAVYELSRANGKLERLLPGREFTAANGIALSPDEKTLFVASFGDGISAIDLASRAATPLRHPQNVSLAYVDGLYAIEGSLVAIQNGPMLPRVVRFPLDRSNRQILSVQVLERRNPLFDGITTGCLVAGRFYYIANTQIDKSGQPGARLLPLKVLSLAIAVR